MRPALLLFALPSTLACSDDGPGLGPADAAADATSGADASTDAGDPADARPVDALPPDGCPDSPACGSLTYLGADGSDEVRALAFAADGSLLVAGVLEIPPETLGADVPQATSSSGATTGVLLVMDSAALGVRAVFRMGAVVDDVEVQPLTGRIAIISDVGVAVLEADATTLVWESDEIPAGSSLQPTASFGRQVSIGASDGVVAAAHFGRVQIFEEDGALRGTLDPLDDISSLSGGSRFEDIAVDARTERVVMVGWQQACAEQLTAFAVAMSYAPESFDQGDHDGALAWRRYDWTCAQRELAGATSDAKLLRARVLAGEVTVAGTSRGGSMFQRQPDPEGDPRTPAGNQVNDIYDTPTEEDDVNVAYVARFGTDDGAFVFGRFLMARSTRGGNALPIEAFALDVAPGGDVIVAGRASGPIEARDQVTIGGRAVAPYTEPEAFTAILADGLATRERWEVYTAGRGISVARAAALSRDRYAAGGRTNADLLVTDPAFDAEREGGDGFVVAFPR